MDAEAPEREDAPMECAATSVSFDDDSKAYQLQSIALLITPLPVLLLTTHARLILILKSRDPAKIRCALTSA